MLQKSFFQSRARLHFWPVDYVLWIFKACYAYEKCFLESNECFDTNYRIIRHVEMISRQERVTFVDFQEMTLPKSQSLILDAPKKLFSKMHETSFLARRLRSMDFQSMLCIWKTFVRVQGIFWYQLQDHTTRRNDFTAGESDFCRF